MRHFASRAFWEAYDKASRAGPHARRQELCFAEDGSPASLVAVQKNRPVLVGARRLALSRIGGRG